MSAAVIYTWQKNTLLPLLLRHATGAKSELGATLRRVFGQAVVLQHYSAPEHRLYEHDDDGQWGDDGGRCLE
jgi:hypothetical protein